MEAWYPKVTFVEEMMSQRFTLFYAGYTVYVPALYFGKLELIETCKSADNELVRNAVSTLLNNAKENKVECSTQLATAINLAKNLEIEILEEPTNYQDYFTWLLHYIEGVETEFPMSRIDHYYFLYARKISEITYNLELLKTYSLLALSTNSPLDFARKIEKSLKDVEFILFKLMAAAALLSSEPRQNYFNVYYKTLCDEFNTLKEMDATNLSESTLKFMKQEVLRFEEVVAEGFQKCITLLKELGI
jgi:hypothetical protein